MDGQQLDPTIETDHEAFNTRYIDSWRISQDESFFHYEPGESTSTFQIDDYPPQPFSLDDIPAGDRDDAERICRELGITREDLLPACICDVALTEDPLFASASFTVQTNTPTVPPPFVIIRFGHLR